MPARSYRITPLRAPFCTFALCVLLGLSTSTPARAQDWPSRPIRLFIGFAAGSTADVVARIVARYVGERLGQPIVVDSRPGGTGLIANDAVLKSAPDGSTLGLLSGGHAVTAAIMKSLPYDPVNGFAWISTVLAYPIVVGVRPDSPDQSMADLIARAKAAPGQLSYGSPGTGSIHHMFGEWLNVEAGTKILAELHAVLALPEIRTRFADVGAVPAPITQTEFKDKVAKEVARWKRIVELKNIERQ